MSLSRVYTLGVETNAPLPQGFLSELLVGGTHIPREQLRTLTQAEHIVTQAQATAEQIKRHAAQILDAARQVGHDQGVAQGRAEAVADVLGTLEVSQRLRQLLVDQLCEVVEHCMRQVLGDLGEAQGLRLRITQLLQGANSPPSERVCLHVGPSQLSVVEDIIAQASQDATHPLAGLRVELDEQRAPDNLLLETRAGFVQADLSLTLREVSALVRRAVLRAQSTLEGHA